MPQHKKLNLSRHYESSKDNTDYMYGRAGNGHVCWLTSFMDACELLCLLIVFLMRNTFPLKRGGDNTHWSEPSLCHSLMRWDKPPSVVIVDVDASRRSPGLLHLSVFSLSWPSWELGKNGLILNPATLITTGQCVLQPDLRAESRQYTRMCGKAAAKCKDRAWITAVTARTKRIIFNTGTCGFVLQDT